TDRFQDRAAGDAGGAARLERRPLQARRACRLRARMHRPATSRQAEEQRLVAARAELAGKIRLARGKHVRRGRVAEGPALVVAARGNQRRAEREQRGIVTGEPPLALQEDARTL